MNRIKMGKHLNMEAVILESKNIRIKVLPRLGFKIASIIYKDLNKEFLFQPAKGEYHIPMYGDDFSKYDTSGLDEMLPTIDRSKYPIGNLKGNILPDHGDVWSLPWEIELLDNSILGKVRLKSLPLEFTKIISFKDEDTIKMDYSVKNLKNEDIYYLWALHGLNVFDEDTEFIFQKDMLDPVNVYDKEDLSKLDLNSLRSYKDKRSYKYYFQGDGGKGEAGLDYKKDRIKYIIKYDRKVQPYLGVWITKGGFKGEYNCALEPSNGFYDSLSLAYENKKIPLLKGKKEDTWTIYININKY